MLKLLSGIAFFIGAIMLAFAVRIHFRERHKIFEDVAHFCSQMKTSISFLKRPLNEIVGEFESENKGEFATYLLNFWQKMELGIEKKQVEKSNGFLNNQKSKIANKIKLKKEGLPQLSKKEKEMIDSFLKSLGKVAKKEQLAEIEVAEKKFQEVEKKTGEEAKRLGDMYFKLCIILGFALLLILL